MYYQTTKIYLYQVLLNISLVTLRLYSGNSFLQGAGRLATISNHSDCWVYTEFPTAASSGLLWWIQPANQTPWDWLQG